MDSLKANTVQRLSDTEPLPIMAERQSPAVPPWLTMAESQRRMVVAHPRQRSWKVQRSWLGRIGATLCLIGLVAAVVLLIAGVIDLAISGFALAVVGVVLAAIPVLQAD